jgi:MFS family permease
MATASSMWRCISRRGKVLSAHQLRLERTRRAGGGAPGQPDTYQRVGEVASPVCDAASSASPIVSPIAGALADRYGNRPFMAIGLILQAVGLAWTAIADVGVTYLEFSLALIVARVGTSLCFPTVATVDDHGRSRRRTLGTLSPRSGCLVISAIARSSHRSTCPLGQ